MPPGDVDSIDGLIENVTLNLVSANPDKDITINVNRDVDAAEEAAVAQAQETLSLVVNHIPGGIYRVGPLARLNNAVACGTPYADVALAEFRMLQDRGPVTSSFHYHYARLVEIIYAIEMMGRLLREPEILSKRVRARARSNSDEGIGVAEAPRGTLMHHYRIDDHGLITWVNLIIATGHNNLAMNQSIRQVAQAYVDGNQLREGMLNRVEAVIRCYDPCLSCASHAFGQMPLLIELRDAAGQVLSRLSRP